MNTTIAQHTLESLRSVVTGNVLVPDNNGYDAARLESCR